MSCAGLGLRVVHMCSCIPHHALMLVMHQVPVAQTSVRGWGQRESVGEVSSVLGFSVAARDGTHSILLTQRSHNRSALLLSHTAEIDSLTIY